MVETRGRKHSLERPSSQSGCPPSQQQQQHNGRAHRQRRPRSAPASSAKRKREADPSSLGSRQRVHVAVRVRPQSEREVEAQSVPVVDVISESEVLVRETLSSSVDYLRANRLKTRQFAFDSAFGRESSQHDVYSASAANLVTGVASFRYNATCFCYGATGAGKTYTMLGTEHCPGVMLLALRDLYTRLGRTGASVTISFIEIYNEQVRDLLSSSNKELVLREDPRKGVTVSGMTELKADSVDGVMEFLHQGNGRRTTEPTNKNATSSRSHAILQVMVESPNSGCVSKLSMIDLAGSERTLSSESRTARSAEGAHINKSLLALSGCISSLVEGRKHIPYRDSKLTQLLKDSLGGSCQTAMIANVSPSHLAFSDTSNTLHWASRAKQIRSTTQLNEETMEALNKRSIAEAREQRRASSGGQSPANAKLQEENRRLTEENRELKGEVEELKRKVEQLSGSSVDESPRRGDRQRRRTGNEPAEYVRGRQGPSHEEAGPSSAILPQNGKSSESEIKRLQKELERERKRSELLQQKQNGNSHAIEVEGVRQQQQQQRQYEQDAYEEHEGYRKQQQQLELQQLQKLHRLRQQHPPTHWHSSPWMQCNDESLHEEDQHTEQRFSWQLVQCEAEDFVADTHDGQVKRRDSIRWQRKRERRASKENVPELQQYGQAQQQQFEELQQQMEGEGHVAGMNGVKGASEKGRNIVSSGGLAELDLNKSRVLTRSAAARTSKEEGEGEEGRKDFPKSVSPLLKRKARRPIQQADEGADGSMSD